MDFWYGYAIGHCSDLSDYGGRVVFGFARVFGLWNPKHPFERFFLRVGGARLFGLAWLGHGEMWRFLGDSEQRWLLDLCGSVALASSRWDRLTVRDGRSVGFGLSAAR